MIPLIVKFPVITLHLLWYNPKKRAARQEQPFVQFLQKRQTSEQVLFLSFTLNVYGVETLFTFFDFKRNIVILLDFIYQTGSMNKNFFVRIIDFDEAVTFVFIKKLNSSCLHGNLIIHFIKLNNLCKAMENFESEKFYHGNFSGFKQLPGLKTRTLNHCKCYANDLNNCVICSFKT